MGVTSRLIDVMPGCADVEVALEPFGAVVSVPLMDRALAAADRMMNAHEETFRKLAK